MKGFNGKMLLLVAVLCFSGVVSGFTSKDKALAELDRVSKVVFGAGNLYAARNTNINQWFDFLRDVQTFVDKNSGGDKVLNEAMTLCYAVSTEATNSIKLAYNLVFDPAKAAFKSDDDDDHDFKSLKTSMETLQKRSTDIFDKEELLKKTSYYLPGKVKVKKVLLEVLNKLLNAVWKIFDDFGAKKRPSEAAKILARRKAFLDGLSEDQKAIMRESLKKRGRRFF